MTSDDKVDAPVDDDELGSIPRMIPEREDIADRQGRRSSMQHTKSPLPSGSPAAGHVKPHSTRNVFASGMLVPVLFMLSLVIALGGIIYVYKLLQETQQNLAAATTRVEQLEARLVTTDSSLTKSEVLLGAKLKSMDVLIEGNKVEVHKLWGASEKNTQSIQVQAASMQQQKIQLQTVTDQAQQTASQVATDGALLKTVDSTVKETAQRMEIVQESLNDLGADTKSLKDKQSHLEGDMGKRVTALEDTAKSTDVFRRNTLDELRKLREELSRQQTQAGLKPAP